MQINFSSEGCGGMMVNVIFKGKASATDFCVCQFLDVGNLHISWMKENMGQCKREQERRCTAVLWYHHTEQQEVILFCCSTFLRLVLSADLVCCIYIYNWETVFELSAAWKRAWKFGHVTIFSCLICSFREMKLCMWLDKINWIIGK